jgi:hypothetical protein
MLLGAVDERLAAAAVSCGNTENVACAGFNPPGATDDAEQNFLGGGPIGFDRWDLLYPLAPKPLLLMVSAKDFFGTYSPSYLSSGRQEFGKLKKVYEVLGKPENLAWGETPLPHSLSYDMRLRIYRWFLRWLRGEDQAVEEPPVTVEKDETLWVGPTGNVVRDFASQTPFSLNRTLAAGIHTPERAPDVAGLLGIRPAGPVPRASLGKAPARKAEIEALEFETEPGVFVPAWLLSPREPDPSRPLLIVLEPSGRNPRLRGGGLYEELTSLGIVVCAPDVRGIGDLRPEYGRGAPHYTGPHQDEENYAWASLILGSPLVGQRVTDVLSVARALGDHAPSSGRTLVMAASGNLTVPALLAAALEPKIGSLYLSGGLVSFRSVVEAEQYDHSFANFLPGVLHHTDLPQLAASIAPRKVTLAGAVDAAGRPMDAAVVRRHYERALNVEILPEARWDAESLSRL